MQQCECRWCRCDENDYLAKTLLHPLKGSRNRHIGAPSFQHIFPPLCSQASIAQDFQTLREQAQSEGLFQARPLFYCLQLGHILVLEALAWLIIWLWGSSWTLTFLCSIMLAIAQVTRTSASLHGLRVTFCLS